MSYQITILKKALKDMEALSAKTNKQISKAIDDLAENPRPHGCKKLKGEQEYIWRIRVGDYRILYPIDDIITIVEVRRVGHRRNIYE